MWLSATIALLFSAAVGTMNDTITVYFKVSSLSHNEAGGPAADRCYAGTGASLTIRPPMSHSAT